MKSALELAMEKADQLSGQKTKKLTEAQKKQIADLRQIAKAKKAEIQIMMDEKIKKMTQAQSDPTEVEKQRREFMDQMDKIDRDTDAKAEKIKEA